MRVCHLGMRIGALLVAVVSATSANAAASCPLPEAIKATHLDRGFHQEKFVSGLDKPLRSEGRIKTDNDEIVWHMLKPFDVKTVITQGGIAQSVDGGALTPVSTGSGEVAGSIAKSMAAMMQGDWDALKSTFDVNVDNVPTGSPWSVKLTPHDDRLKSMLGNITVQGCADVETVDIGRSDGDREHIAFDKVAP